MTTTRIALVALVTGALTPMVGASPATAQYYRGDGYDRPPAYYDHRSRREHRLGRICVTGRGSCMSEEPAPFEAPCACTVPGFGVKRGQIGG
jgi:hypothetical protein